MPEATALPARQRRRSYGRSACVRCACVCMCVLLDSAFSDDDVCVFVGRFTSTRAGTHTHSAFTRTFRTASAHARPKTTQTQHTTRGTRGFGSPCFSLHSLCMCVIGYMWWVGALFWFVSASNNNNWSESSTGVRLRRGVLTG